MLYALEMGPAGPVLRPGPRNWPHVGTVGAVRLWTHAQCRGDGISLSARPRALTIREVGLPQPLVTGHGATRQRRKDRYAAGVDAPGYALVDVEQNLRAIADPYGYRTIIDGARGASSWSHVKTLYK